MASSLPTVSYSSTQAIMENATQFPWCVQRYACTTMVHTTQQLVVLMILE